jgi:hypothetical protein
MDTGRQADVNIRLRAAKSLQRLQSLKRCVAKPPIVVEEWPSMFLRQSQRMHLTALAATWWRGFACLNLSAGLCFERRCSPQRNRRRDRALGSEVLTDTLDMLDGRCTLPAQNSWSTLGKTSAWKKQHRGGQFAAIEASCT